MGQALRVAAEAKKPLHFLTYTMLEFVDNVPDYDLNQPCGQYSERRYRRLREECNGFRMWECLGDQVFFIEQSVISCVVEKRANI